MPSESKGFVLLWRKMWDNPICKRPHVFTESEAWIYIFSNLARGVEGNGLRRGEFEASRGFLARKWMWSESRVLRFLRRLESLRMTLKPNSGANSKPNNQPNKFIVCNYETYQNPRTANRTAERTAERTHIKESIKEGLNDPSLFDLENDQKDSGSLLSTEPPTVPKRKPPATACPETMTITDSMKAWAKDHTPAVDSFFQTEAFLDFHRSKGNVFKDWEAAWRTWMRNAQKWSQSGTTGRGYRDIHEVNRQTLDRFVSRGKP